MSRADDLRDAHEAELAVVELEDKLVAMKEEPKTATGEGHGSELSDEYRATKLALREARQRFRELRDGTPAEDGDAVATPVTVEATSSAPKRGGTG